MSLIIYGECMIIVFQYFFSKLNKDCDYIVVSAVLAFSQRLFDVNVALLKVQKIIRDLFPSKGIKSAMKHGNFGSS